MQKIDDQVCRRLGLLFRDPVPAIRDDHIFDVIGDTPHHVPIIGPNDSFRHRRPRPASEACPAQERPVSPQSWLNAKNWRSPLALRRVAHRAPHNARAVDSSNRFGSRIVRSRSGRDRCARGRRPGAPCPDHRAKVPHGRILCDLIPGPDTGQRASIATHLLARSGGGGSCEAHHDADVVRHQFGRSTPRRLGRPSRRR